MLAINVALVSILSLLALGTAEVYLRMTIPASSSESIFEPTRTSKRFKVMKSNARIVSWGSELRTNALGFRDDKANIPAKQPGEFRIVVLGDSFTVSAGVNYDEIYTSVLEKRLKQSYPRVRVINLAVGGYNPIQYDLVLQEVGFGLQPDLLVVAVFPFNDLNNDDYRANEAYALGTAVPRVKAWYEDLYVYRAFLYKVHSRLRNMFSEQTSATSTGSSAVSATGKSDAEQNLEALNRIVTSAAARGLETLIVLLPNTDDFASQRPTFAPVVDLCKIRQWRCRNLLDPFTVAAIPPSSLRLNPLDGHPNEKYNALVARFIFDDLQKYLIGRDDLQKGSALPLPQASHP